MACVYTYRGKTYSYEQIIVKLQAEQKLTAKELEEVLGIEEVFGKVEKMSDIHNYSGGAYGADTEWDLVGREFGVDKHTHFRGSDNLKVSKRLIGKGVKGTAVDDKKLALGYEQLERIYNRKFEKSLTNDLKARNYFQVVNADAVYAIGTLNPRKTNVSGGTASTVEMAKTFRKPIYIFDIASERWFEYNGSGFVITDTPILTKNFAGVGTRDIELYDKNVQGTWVPNPNYVGDAKRQAALKAIRDVYAKTAGTVNSTKTVAIDPKVDNTITDDLVKTPEPITPDWETKEFKENKPAIRGVFENPEGTALHTLEGYGFAKEHDGATNVKNILAAIAGDSNNASFKTLAKLFTAIDKKFNVLNGINIKLDGKNGYSPSTNTLTLDTNNPKFADTLQYTVLHELMHVFTAAKLRDGSETSTFIKNRINRFIAVLEDNLVDYGQQILGDGETTRNLPSLLAAWREAVASGQTAGFKFNSAEERTLVNGLANPDEFLAHIMSDELFQDFANNYKLKGETKTIKEMFLDMLKGIFDAFRKALGVTVIDASVLDQALDIAFHALQRTEIEVKGTDEFQYYGAMYAVSFDANGYAVDVNITKNKGETKAKFDARKQKLLDAYNENPNVDPQNGKAFRNPPAAPSKEELAMDPDLKYVIKTLPDGTPVFANEEQKVAIDVIVEHLNKPSTGDRLEDSLLLIGSGGTGKTASVFAAVKEFMRQSGVNLSNIVFAAPTHNATDELRMAIDDQEVAKNNVKTFASFSGTELVMKDGEESFEPISIEDIMTTYERTGGLPLIFTADYFILDEVSMLGQGVADLIKDRLEQRKKFFNNRNVKFLFMGDHKQIPPIDGGSRDDTAIDKDSPFINLRLQPGKSVKLTRVMRTDNPDILGLLGQYAANIDKANSLIDRVLEIDEAAQAATDLKHIVPSNPNPFKQRKDSVNIKYIHRIEDIVDGFIEAFKADANNVRQAVIINYNKYSRPETQSIITAIRKKLFGVEGAMELYNPGELLIANSVIKINEELQINPNERVIVKSVKRKRHTQVVRNRTQSFTIDADAYELQVVNKKGEHLKLTILDPNYVAKFGPSNYSKEKKGYVIDGKVAPYALYKMDIKPLLYSMNYGYVVNTHKVQGSSYNYVFVDEGNILRQAEREGAKPINQFLYTAMSRVRHKLVIYNLNNPIQSTSAFNSDIEPNTLALPGLRDIKAGLEKIASRSVKPPVVKQTVQELEKAKTINYLKEQRRILYQKRDSIKVDPKLTDAERAGKIEATNVNIANLDDRIDEATLRWSLQVLVDTAYDAFRSVDNLLSRPTFDEFEVSAAVETVQTYKNLIFEMQANYGNNIDPTLASNLEGIKDTARAVEDRVLNLAKLQARGFVADKAGNLLSLDQLYSNQEDTGWFASNALSGIKSRVVLTREISKILATTSTKIDKLREHEKDVDEKPLAEFLKKFKFSDIIRVEKYKNRYGVEGTRTQYRTRYLSTYYNARNVVYSKANAKIQGKDIITKDDMRAKQEAIRQGLANIEFSVDIRYLFPEDYNTLMGKEYLTPDMVDKYLERLKDIMYDQFGDLENTYVEKRLAAIIEQAKEKYDSYRNREGAYRLQLEADGLSPEDIEAEMRDYFAYNHPMLWLNEYSPLVVGNDVYIFTTPRLSRTDANGNPMYVKDYQVDDEGSWSKVRRATDYLVTKPKRKNGQVNLGFYDEEYLQMEKDDFEAAPDAQTLLKFSNWAIETEKKYSRMFPSFMRMKKMYFHMTDIRKDMDDLMREANIIGKIKLLPAYIWDKYVIDNVSTKNFDGYFNKVDTITGEIKRTIRALSFDNQLNKSGMGDLRLMDPVKYYSVLRDAAIFYEQMSLIESNVRLAQYLYNHPRGLEFVRRNMMGTVQTDDTNNPISYSAIGVTDKSLFDWTINNIMYGETKAHSGSITTSTGGKVKRKYQLTKTQVLELEKLENDLAIMQGAKEKLASYPTLTYTEQIDLLLELKAISPETHKRMAKNTNVNLLNKLSLKVKDLNDTTDERIQSYTERIEKIKTSRMLTGTKMVDAAKGYIIALNLGFNPVGRYLDFFSSGLINNLHEAVDGRNFGLRDYMKAFLYVMPAYGLNNFMEVTALSALYLHQYWLAGLLFGATRSYKGQTITAALYNGMTQLAFQEQKEKKLQQLLMLYNAFEDANSLTDNALQLTAKSNVKFLNPFNLVEKTEQVNRGLTALAVLYATKIEDKQGRQRSLVDAYTLDSEGKLVWNTKDFNDAASHGYEENGKSFKTISAKILGVINKVHGNYSTKTPTQIDKSTLAQFALIFRKWLPEAIDTRFASFGSLQPKTDALTGQRYIGTYSAVSSVVRGKFSGQDYEKAALKRAAMDGIIMLSLGKLSLMLYEYLTVQVGGDDDPEEKSKEGINMTYLYNLLARTTGDQIMFVDPSIFQKRSSVQGFHPAMKVISNGFRTLDDISRLTVGNRGDFSKEEADAMSIRELNARNIPVYDLDYLGRYPDPRKDVAYAKDETGNVKKPMSLKHYQSSRTWDDAQNLIPFLRAVKAVQNTQEQEFAPPTGK